MINVCYLYGIPLTKSCLRQLGSPLIVATLVKPTYVLCTLPIYVLKWVAITKVATIRGATDCCKGISVIQSP